MIHWYDVVTLIKCHAWWHVIYLEVMRVLKCPQEYVGLKRMLVNREKWTELWLAELYITGWHEWRAHVSLIEKLENGLTKRWREIISQVWHDLYSIYNKIKIQPNIKFWIFLVNFTQPQIRMGERMHDGGWVQIGFTTSFVPLIPITCKKEG